jgi:hypothetical protein
MSEINYFKIFTMQDDVEQLHVRDINWWMV